MDEFFEKNYYEKCLDSLFYIKEGCRFGTLL